MKTSIKQIPLGMALIAMSTISLAHTRLQTPVIDENNARHGSNYNNEVIAHGCKTTDGKNRTVLGTVVVFPDGTDSTITVDGETTDKPLSDFVTNWGSPVAKIQDKDVFVLEQEIETPLGNVVGFWSAGTPGLRPGLTGLIPFRTRGVIINPESCAKSVKFIVAIADVCEVTSVAGFSPDKVNLWTPAVGSNFDGDPSGHGYNSPASLTVNRSDSPLPAACGAGVDVVVTPSASQLNRDMPVKINGVQVWPKP